MPSRRCADDGTTLRGRHNQERAADSSYLELDKALALFGPLEARIMRAIWTHTVEEPFVGRQAQSAIPTRAYTTVMTTLNRSTVPRVLQAITSLWLAVRKRTRWSPGLEMPPWRHSPPGFSQLLRAITKSSQF